MNQEIKFYKYQGCGNDFILIDDRQNSITLTTGQIEKLCDRRFGIGADGLMLLRSKEGYDFQMVYYNADGNESTMCGNGGRCITRFASDLGITLPKYNFLAIDGPHDATIEANGIVNLKMIDVHQVASFPEFKFLNTGSPHVVMPVTDILNIDVYNKGKEIRYSDTFTPGGTNVNFTEVTDNNTIFVRTYERGVEDETLSCGTGVTACALIQADLSNNTEPQTVNVKTRGGNLKVMFTAENAQTFSNIWLCGPAEKVFEGNIQIQGL